MKFLLALILTIPLLAAANPTKPVKKAKSVKMEISSTERLKTACVKQAKDAAMKSPEQLCECVSRNMSKLTEKERSLIARTYEGDEKAEAELEKSANAALQNYDVEVAENCLADPTFKVPN